MDLHIVLRSFQEMVSTDVPEACVEFPRLVLWWYSPVDTVLPLTRTLYRLDTHLGWLHSLIFQMRCYSVWLYSERDWLCTAWCWLVTNVSDKCPVERSIIIADLLTMGVDWTGIYSVQVDLLGLTDLYCDIMVLCCADQWVNVLYWCCLPVLRCAIELHDHWHIRSVLCSTVIELSTVYIWSASSSTIISIYNLWCVLRLFHFRWRIYMICIVLHDHWHTRSVVCPRSLDYHWCMQYAFSSTIWQNDHSLHKFLQEQGSCQETVLLCWVVQQP